MAPVMGDNGVIVDWTFRGFSNPEAVVQGIRNVKQGLQNMNANLYGGFPEVYDDFVRDYKSRKMNVKPAGGSGESADLAKARAYLQKFPNGKDADRARKIVEGK